MVQISKPVGLGAANLKHDVATIQAALKNVETRLTNKPAWSGRIDGMFTKKLEQAIELYQTEFQTVKVTGKIETSGPSILSLNSALNRNFPGLRGVPGTCLVYITPRGPRDVEKEAREAKADAPFPFAESQALAEIISKIGKKFGLCLERKREFVTREGRFAVALDFMDVRWIDNGSGRVMAAGREPNGVIQAVCREIQSNRKWAVGATNDLVFTSKLQITALQKIGSPTAADLKALGLTQSPKHEVLSAIVAACARLLRSGNILTTKGKGEHKILVDAVDSVDKSLAIRLKTAVQTCRQLKVALGNLGIRADSETRAIAKASDDLASRSKELGVIATCHINVAKAHFLSAIALLAAREIATTIKCVRDGLKFLEAADETLIRDDTATNLSTGLADKSKALGLTCEEMSAVIERREELRRA